MQLTDLTFHVSLVLVAVVALYTLIYSGLTGLLMSTAVALIAAAFFDSFEVVAGITTLFALIYTLYLKPYFRRMEGFQSNDAKQISSRIQSIVGGRTAKTEPTGVLSSSGVEGFEDLQPQLPKDGASQTSTAAPTSATVHQVNDQNVKAVTSAIASTETEKKATQATQDASIANEEFQSATNQLFKLGKMPSEHEEGPKLDAGQTLMKAMGSLDPNTISAMTTDTKKLLETQKGLMQMLTQMRPVLADGKELLQTFSGMFGAGAPAMIGKM